MNVTPRLLTIKQAMQLTGMGRDTCKKWCRENGAFLKIGNLHRYDREVIDKVLEDLHRVQDPAS